jgi:hypothetical protein
MFAEGLGEAVGELGTIVATDTVALCRQSPGGLAAVTLLSSSQAQVDAPVNDVGNRAHGHADRDRHLRRQQEQRAVDGHAAHAAEGRLDGVLRALRGVLVGADGGGDACQLVPDLSEARPAGQGPAPGCARRGAGLGIEARNRDLMGPHCLLRGVEAREASVVGVEAPGEGGHGAVGPGAFTPGRHGSDVGAEVGLGGAERRGVLVIGLL